MNEKLRSLNQTKKEAEKLTIIGAIIVIIGAISFVLLSQYGPWGLIIITPGVIVVIAGINKFNKVNKRFKNDVLTDLITGFFDEATYSPSYGLDEFQVYSAESVKRADRFHSEDYIKGRLQNVDFISSDVKLEERHVRHTKNGTRTYYETYFLGRFFIFDFNKKFEGYLQVLERGRPQRKRKYNKIELESVAFNKKFRTYTTNDHAAFYVLTPHLMEKLLEFEQRNMGTVLFSFLKNKLYIGINNHRDTFELKMFQPLNEETFAEFEAELSVVKDIIEELKLNNTLFKEE